MHDKNARYICTGITSNIAHGSSATPTSHHTTPQHTAS